MHVRGTEDLVKVCLHTQPTVPQHSQDAGDRCDRDVGSRNAESSRKDVVLTGELNGDGFFLIHHEFVCNHPGSDLLNIVLYIANSPSGVKDLEGHIELGLIRIQLHTVAGCVGSLYQQLRRNKVFTNS